MNDNKNLWYLDRGKNFFTSDGKELFDTIINICNTYSYVEKMTSKELIEKFPLKLRSSGNPNALLTTARNIGIINKENKLGKNVNYYLNDKLTYKELIFENLTKVNYDKESTYAVKPFVVVCKALYRLYTLDKNEAFITKGDCIEYLYGITDYFDITDEYCMKIIKNHNYEKVSSPVLDIWFNALKNFEIFEDSDNSKLKLNENEIEFYKFIDKKGGFIPCYLHGKSKYATYYDDLGSCDLGINYIIPNVDIKLIDNSISMSEIKELYEYLFGIGPYKNNNLANRDYYAIYRPFKSIKNIAIRRIENDNKYVGDLLFEYNNYILKNN